MSDQAKLIDFGLELAEHLDGAYEVLRRRCKHPVEAMLIMFDPFNPNNSFVVAPREFSQDELVEHATNAIKQNTILEA